MTLSQPAKVLSMDSQVSEAIQAFAQALANTSEFQTFDENYHTFKSDPAAQQVVRVFQEKQRSLQMMQQLGMLEQNELDELKRLREMMLSQPSVQAYLDAQNALMLVCQTVAQELSAVIGLDFANACVSSSCCG